MRVDGTGDAVQIPALALVVADFSELVVGPIIGNWESQITREPRRHIGDEGGTCVAGIDDTAADVARSVDAHTITASEGLSDSLEVRQDIAGHLVIGRIEVYSEVDMGGRDAKTLRRLTSGLGMSSAVCRGEMLQLRGVLLEDREEPHAAPSDALELTRTDGLKVMRNTWIRRISAIRKDGVESAINLTCGLNCIIGASNTGKTRIAKTVEFACGGKELPFTNKTAYEIAQVTFVTNGGEVSLSRSIHVQNTIHVKSSNPMIVPGSYSVSSRAGKSINTVLLALLGVESTRRIATNETYHTVAFTWNAIRHLMIVPEDQIGRARPSILFPKSTSLATLTQSLSSLLVLVQDEKIDNSIQTESASERHARRKAVEQFIHQQLDDIEPRIRHLEEMRHIATNEGKTIHTYLEDLHKKALHVEQQRQTLLNRDAHTISHISQLNQQYEHLEVLIRQRKVLISQYESDAARLDLQLQAMKHARTHAYPATCQFCHSPIHMSVPTEQDILIVSTEIEHIHRIQADVETDLAILVDKADEVQQELHLEKQQHRQNMHSLKSDIQPTAQHMQQDIEQIAHAEQLHAEYAELIALHARFNKALDDAGQATQNDEKYKPRECFQSDFWYSMNNTIRSILQQCHFQGADTADFSRSSFDVEIAGYSKADEQGKGYCAFLNSVVMLAFHDYLNEQSKHTPGWLLIDTPLHGFDEGIRPLEDSSMKVGLFSYLAKQAVSQQIIIIENTNHMAGIPLDDNINIVEFSKDKHNGRYGYLDGIYDVSDES